jgi:hypothetical protein
MANLTVTVDEQVLRRARIRALEQGTSVNAVVSEFLASWAGDDAAVAAIQRFVDRGRTSNCGSGPQGRSWTREGLYDRR